MLWRYLLAVAATLFVNTGGQSESCPRVCRCDRRKTVYCNERQMDLIPYGIPADTETLHLQINNITNGVITDEILSNLNHLKKLDLHQNQLTSVPQRLPRSLEYVDFRSNDIRFVGKISLSGLTSLSELHLDGNNITNRGISPFAFHDSLQLRMLVLSNNLLTAFPENLPASLQILRLENNIIRQITAKATRGLGYLINLDLSLNAIAETAIESEAFLSMTSLRSLDLSRNRLTEVPRSLPESLEELMLSNNQIEYIFSNENEVYGSLTSLRNLIRVDVSSNNIKSIQTSAFAHLHLDSVALHGNPWQCDCHLRYFKQWLSSDGSTLSSESNIRCHSPSEFAGVTLNSIDEEALACEARQRTRDMMKILDLHSTGFTFLWSGSRETSDPLYIKRYLMYGPLKCRNCSIENDFSMADRLNSRIVDYLQKYSSQDITSAVRANPINASVLVSNLQPESNYAVCVFDSEQNDDEVTVNQCTEVRTSAKMLAPPLQDDIVFLPLWLIVLCCVVVLLLLVTIVGVVVWRKRNSLKSKTPRMYASNRDDIFCTQSQVSDLMAMAYRQASLSPNYGTSMTDRTYAECGPPASTVSRTYGESGVDARMEFEVLLKPDASTNRVHTPLSSLDSECQDNSTLSTNRTGRTSTSHNQGVSPPPTYDSLHSYTPIDQRTALPNHSHESGSFV